MSSQNMLTQQQSPRFGSEQYATMLSFLEDPVNRGKVFGVSGKTEVGVPPSRKNAAWKELANIINNKYKGKFFLDAKSVGDRWRNYMNKYKAAREKASGTGFGLTEEDKKRNIHTIQAKMDFLCPHYERMHALVGDRPNIAPAAVFDSGSVNADTDLNEMLKFNDEEVMFNYDGDTHDTGAGSSGFHESSFTPGDPVINVDNIDLCNEDVDLNQRTEFDDLFADDIDVNPVGALGSKRVVDADDSMGKKSKKDRRKDLPSISAGKTPTHSRNHFAQIIQDSAAAKAAALVAIEEKRLKFEQTKWETDREERERMRMEEQACAERVRKEDLEFAMMLRKEEQEIADRRRAEDKEEERLKRAEAKAEKDKERRFALMQTLIAEGKSTEEIKYLLDMLL